MTKWLRHTNALIAIFAIVCLAFAFVLQYFFAVEPCLLCWLQRYAYVGIIVVSLAACIWRGNLAMRLIYFVARLVFIAGGLIFAGRQVWLQHLPAGKVTACLPDFNYLVQHVPIMKAIQIAYVGTTDCSQVHGLFLGLSMAGWSLLAFFLILVLSIFPLRQPVV